MKYLEIIKTIDDEWEWYIGKLYTYIIENSIKHPIKTIVELGPGYKYKIANTLKDINFNGVLYIIDNNIDVLNFVKLKYKEILPNCTIICINGDFLEAINQLPEEIDLFISNHPIDDLMINEYIIRQNLDDKYINNVDLLSKYWNTLCQNQQEINEIINIIYNKFITFFNIIKCKTVIIAQYNSNAFLTNNSLMNYYVHQCLIQLKQSFYLLENDLYYYRPFDNDIRYNYKELLENTQNLDNWLIGTYNRKEVK